MMPTIKPLRPKLWLAPMRIRFGWSSAGPANTDSPPLIRSANTINPFPRLQSASAATAAEPHLHQEGITLRPGSLLASARRVEAGDITNTQAFRNGEAVIQDEASQLVAALVGHALPERSQILDCCAAPGGKTLAIADHNPMAAITAVELHPHRARLLQKLLHAHPSESARIQIVTADAQHLPVSQQFDRVLADVPCSGTGTLARNPEIKWRLTL